MRKATQADIPAICRIFTDAKKSLADAGVDQWQRGYPNGDNVLSDIAEDTAFLIEHEGEVCAYMMLRGGEEKAYRSIFDGKWPSGENSRYMTIHRIAVASVQKHKGIARTLLENAERIAREQMCNSLRIDTHADNKPMRAFLEKQDSALCGKITLLSGPEAGNLRVCYEKIFDIDSPYSSI